MDLPSSSNLNPAQQTNTNSHNNNGQSTGIIRSPLPRINIPTIGNSNSSQNSQPQSNQHPNFTRTQSPAGTSGPRKPPGFFVYPEKIVKEGVSACQRSILGKLITNKPVHVNSIQRGLDNIWGSPPGLKIEEIEGKILQFFMDDTKDQERILLGNPWTFRNSWLIIHPWDRNSDPSLLDFDHAAVWVQLWGLPPHCKTKQMGRSIGELLGRVEESEFYEYPRKKMIIKIKVALDVHQPITPGILIGNENDGTHWIDFRYENLPQICFNCGLLGHEEKLCHNQKLEVEDSAPLGPWIRSNQYGRRVMEAKDRKYHSNPSMSKDFGQYSPPIPASMLAQMKAMKVQDDMEEASSQTRTESPKNHTNQPQKNQKT
jgi:hypothetical protein